MFELRPDCIDTELGLEVSELDNPREVIETLEELLDFDKAKILVFEGKVGRKKKLYSPRIVLMRVKEVDQDDFVEDEDDILV